MSAPAASFLNMASPNAVDAPPASRWSEPRPAGLAPQLWAHTRPTDATLAGLQLPSGIATYGDDGRLLAWRSAPGALPDPGELWLRCARQFPETGLWPLCGSNWSDFATERAWGQHTSDPYALATDVYQAAALSDRSDDDEPDFTRELLEGFGLKDTSMTIARRPPWPKDPLSRLVAPDDANYPAHPEWPGELTLAACRRPADAVFLCDFGVTNNSATPGIFAGVLRSWEMRFGVVPSMLRPSWTAFEVIAPPTDDAEVDRLAAEIVYFAMDSAIQGGFHIPGEDGNVRAQQMVRSREWQIWWD